MKREMWASLKNDHKERTKQVGEDIEAKLAKGDVQEAFRHLKGWYPDATETEAWPCKQTMERQTKEREELYEKRVSPRAPIPTHYHTAIRNDTPSDGEIRTTLKKSSNGRAAGASNMRAKHLKAWLTVMEREEEDPECKEGKGDIWKQLVKLV